MKNLSMEQFFFDSINTLITNKIIVQIPMKNYIGKYKDCDNGSYYEQRVGSAYGENSDRFPLS
jgi:hypothetical protein